MLMLARMVFRREGVYPPGKALFRHRALVTSRRKIAGGSGGRARSWYVYP
jgi:hypothetical protein